MLAVYDLRVMIRAALVFVMSPLVLGSEIPDNFQSLLDNATGLAPELYCATALRVHDQLPAASLKARIELLESVFDAATSISRPIQFKYLGTYTDTSCWMEALVSALSMDALAVQTSAVQRMASIDVARAIELQQRIVKPKLPDLQCGEVLVPDGAALFATFSILHEAAKGDRRLANMLANAVQQQFAAISSVQEIVPALDLLAQLANDDDALVMLGNTLSIQAASLPRDPAAYAMTVRNGLRQAIAKHLEMLRQRGLSTAGPLEAYGRFLTNQTRAARDSKEASCRPEGIMSSPSVNAWFDPVAGFNEFVRSLGAQAERMAIARSSTEQYQDSVPLEKQCRRYWESTAARRLWDLSRSLPYTTEPPFELLSNEQLMEAAWERRASELLTEALAWKQGYDDNPEDYFHQRCAILRRVITIAPPSSPVAAKAIDALILVLESYTPSGFNVGHLVREVDATLRLTRKFSEQDSQDLLKARNDGIRIPNLTVSDAEPLRRALRTSRSPIVSFLTRLEDASPKSYGSWTR